MVKARSAAICAAVATVLSLAGCGTFDNMCFENSQTGKVPMRVYGGVGADVKFLTEENTDKNVSPAVVLPFKLLYVADLPLSFAADTATLPITAPLAFAGTLAHSAPTGQPIPPPPPNPSLQDKVKLDGPPQPNLTPPPTAPIPTSGR